MKTPFVAAQLAKEMAAAIRNADSEKPAMGKLGELGAQMGLMNMTIDEEDTKSAAEQSIDATLGNVELMGQMMISMTDRAKEVAGAERCTLWLVNPRKKTMWAFLSDISAKGAARGATDTGFRGFT
jgi:hypothetical protein